MAELDKSRDLTFVPGGMIAADGSPGIRIKIPVTAVTSEWNAAFKQLAFDQHVDVRLTRKRDHLLLQLSPRISGEELLRKLNLTQDLVNQASQLERGQLDATSPLEEAALDWWQGG